MIGLISLYFHLGLYIGAPNFSASPSMFGYLLYSRYSHVIFNPKLCVLLIRRVSLFMLLAHKFNYSVLPVVNGFNRYLRSSRFCKYSKVDKFSFAHRFGTFRNIVERLRFSDRRRKQSLLRAYLRALDLRSSSRPVRAGLVRYYKANLRSFYCNLFKNYNHSRCKRFIYQGKMLKRRYLVRLRNLRLRKLRQSFEDGGYSLQSRVVVNNFILNFFHKYSLPILVNMVNLISNWYTYYDNVCACLLAGGNAFSKLHFLFMGTKRNRFRKKSVKSIRFFKSARGSKRFLRIYVTLILRVYHKLCIILEQTKDKRGLFWVNRKRFRKFYLLVKLLLYLRQFRVLPNILFYLDSSIHELVRISKYHICIISLVNSDNSSVGYVTYPIPCSFGNYLSKIFYSHLIVNSFFLGRVLLLLNSIG